MSTKRFNRTTMRRERLLIYAGEKVGKTSAVLEVMTKTGGHAYYIDTDNAIEANISDFPELMEEVGPVLGQPNPYTEEFNRLTRAQPDTWIQYRRTVADFVNKCGPDDFIIFDRVEVMRDAARDYHIEEIYGQGAADWVLETLERKEREGKKGPVDTDIPWSAINSTYYSTLNIAHRKAKGHVIWCAGAKPLITEGAWADKSKLQSFYAATGHKPAGGSDLGYIPHTILYMSKNKEGKRYLTTIGDRGRKDKFLKAQELSSEYGFFMGYMIPIAGWRPQ